MKTELNIENVKPSYAEEDSVKRKQIWDMEQEYADELSLKVRQQAQIIGELDPKRDYVDDILSGAELTSVNEIAEDYDMSLIHFNSLLEHIGVQYRLNGQWLLLDEHQHRGYTKSEVYYSAETATGVELEASWTIKGRLFLYYRLKDWDILPLMEEE